MSAALLTIGLLAMQDPTPGIDRQLAIARAERVRDVRYQLRFRIEPRTQEVAGEIVMTWKLPESDPGTPLVIDFDGSHLGDLEVNGNPAGDQARRVANHVVLSTEVLRGGDNLLTARFRSAVAPTGTPLTVYRDPTDGREYYYTLVVPADAHRLYPCFDQPDIKAVFAWELDLPSDWQAVANTAPLPEPGLIEGGLRRWRFADSKPLPTYLAAFACGDFHVETGAPLTVPGISDQQPLRIFVRKSQQHLLDAPTTFDLHSRGLAWLTKYFGVDYPFGKLDIALLPGFPYGGMEHAGAIFYREQALVFDHPPTAGELVRRSTLIYHELAHQWFGNLVTMRWFDDLWLKEGFATFVAYEAMAELEPERRSWLRFGQRVKPRAYEVDVTAGTTPVYQELQNLADAKSAYGAIVYNKAPAVLRELHDGLGREAFRAGLERFLRQHAFGNATWRDLADALENASRVDLERWSQRWLLSPSLPRVRVHWTADDDGTVTAARLTQEALAGADAGTWPLRLELLVVERDGGRRMLSIASDQPEVALEDLVGKPAPACVLANPRDVAYCQFVPDPASREWLLENAPAEPDLMLRVVMAGSLFEAVREAELDPARYSAAALRLLARERDPDTHAWLLDTLGTCLGRYLTPERSVALRGEAGELLLRQLAEAAIPGCELQAFRFLAWNGAGEDVLALCRAVATFAEVPKGLVPGKSDRFLAAAALLAAGEEDLIATLEAGFSGEDVGKEAFLARAAAPTAENKAAYWQQYLQLESPPEQWTQDSLPYFHWRGQQELTHPYLQRALERVEWVKKNRRIFFMPAWIDGFVNGNSDAEALSVVDRFLAEHRLEDDVRRKILQSRDALHRAVRIRNAFGPR